MVSGRQVRQLTGATKMSAIPDAHPSNGFRFKSGATTKNAEKWRSRRGVWRGNWRYGSGTRIAQKLASGEFGLTQRSDKPDHSSAFQSPSVTRLSSKKPLKTLGFASLLHSRFAFVGAIV